MAARREASPLASSSTLERDFASFAAVGDHETYFTARQYLRNALSAARRSARSTLIVTLLAGV